MVSDPPFGLLLAPLLDPLSWSPLLVPLLVPFWQIGPKPGAFGTPCDWCQCQAVDAAVAFDVGAAPRATHNITKLVVTS